MDPLSQGVIGSNLPQSLSRPEHVRAAAIIGFLAGMLPDIDVVISSSTDPLLFLEYHRQFTHSLFFIPLGGLVAALVLYSFFKKNLSFKTVYLYACLGYGTHGLLDACTTYGTLLFWPFSYYRVAWNNISIIDPLFTLPLLTTMVFAVIKKSSKWAKIGMVWAVFYLGLGVMQHYRALSEVEKLIEARGHQALRWDAKPSFGNLILWKGIYETDDAFYVDAIKVGISTFIYEGQKAQKLDIARDFPELDPGSRQARDIERFRWFSDGYLAVHPHKANVIGDVRYSMLPNSIDPLWGIVIDVNDQEKHVKFENFRSLENRGEFFRMLGL